MRKGIWDLLAERDNVYTKYLDMSIKIEIHKKIVLLFVFTIVDLLITVFNY